MTADATNPTQETSDDRKRGGVIGWGRWLTRRPLVFGGLAGALVFFWLSLTPSLLPRPWFAQAAGSGIAAAIGFGLGSALSAILRSVGLREPRPHTKALAWRVLLGAAIVGTIVMLLFAKHWQNQLRGLMGIDDEPNVSLFGLLALTLFVGSLLLFGARLIRSLTRFLIRQIDRLLPRSVSVAVGIVLSIVIVFGFAQGFLWERAISTMNAVAGTTNGTTSDGTKRPNVAERSGGPGSLVAWDSLGRMGRDFTGRGPTVADLERFSGSADCCKQPIRVYVGLDSADTARGRAALAVKELERTGAFERKVLGVFSATGTGWINPRVASSLEYLHDGDTAEVSMQYSFLPSWLSFLVDQKVASEAGKELIDAVLTKVDSMPAAERPKVLLFGESLGSFATEFAFKDIDELQASTDGALLVGPTFSNPMWKQLTDDRIAGTPQWLPEVRNKGVRFAGTPQDLVGAFDPSTTSRVVYLQNASDPISWWSRDLWYRYPDWAGRPAAPDRSPAFQWMPIITFWQVVMDLTDSLGVPTGHGHHFGSNVVDGWVAISAPDGWTDADTRRLKAEVGERGD